MRKLIVIRCRVGGIVSETNFKYFVQFTFWAALYCLHVLVFVAVFLNREKQVSTKCSADVGRGI